MAISYRIIVLAFILVTTCITNIAYAHSIEQVENASQIKAINLNALYCNKRQDFDFCIDETGSIHIVWTRFPGSAITAKRPEGHEIKNYPDEDPPNFLTDRRQIQYETYYSKGSPDLKTWTTPIRIMQINEPVAKIVCAKSSLYIMSYTTQRIRLFKSQDNGAIWQEINGINTSDVLKPILQPFVYEDKVNLIYLREYTHLVLAIWDGSGQLKIKAIEDTPSCPPTNSSLNAAAQAIDNNGILHLAYWYSFMKKKSENEWIHCHDWRYLNYNLASNIIQENFTNKSEETGPDTKTVEHAEMLSLGDNIALFSRIGGRTNLTYFPKNEPEEQQHLTPKNIENINKAVSLDQKRYLLIWLSNKFAKNTHTSPLALARDARNWDYLSMLHPYLLL